MACNKMRNLRGLALYTSLFKGLVSMRKLAINNTCMCFMSHAANLTFLLYKSF